MSRSARPPHQQPGYRVFGRSYDPDCGCVECEYYREMDLGFDLLPVERPNICDLHRRAFAALPPVASLLGENGSW